MFNIVELPGPRQAWEPPPVKPFDEAVWQAWALKGRARDKRKSAARSKVVKWVSITALLTAVGLWSHLTPYEVVVRFTVTVGAIVVMFQAIHLRRYALAAVFGALALLYNPVAPALRFSSEWQRSLVVASAVPFIVSLIWRPGPRTEHND